jgi:hypothetical protein
MTTEPVPSGGDPRRLLSDARDLARRVHLDQRVTWLPLLVLALVTFGAIPAHEVARISDCHAVNNGQVCKVPSQTVTFYWLAALVLAYVVIAGGYLRVARARGVDARVLPYAVTGVALVGLGFAFVAVWIRLHPDPLTHPEEPSAFAQFLAQLLDPPGAIGLALLVLAWLERHVALLLFTLGYLTVVLVPINFGWGQHWGPETSFIPQLVINGSALLLGSAGFALAQRLRRPR